MIPIVLCASFVPCVKATNPPDTSCARRKPRFTLVGARFATTQVIPRIRRKANATPRNGATSDGMSTLSLIPPLGLLRLDLLLRDAGVRVLAEAPVDEARDLERVLRGAGEED